MKNSRLFFVSTIVGLALASAPLHAQMGTGRVTGQVTDTQGNPIEGAEVVASMSGQELDATTDDKGNFAILGFRSGTYTFTVTAPGYAPFSQEIPIKQIGRNPKLEFELQRAQAGQATGGDQSASLLDEANQLYRQKNYEQALAKYQELLEVDPTLYQIHLNMGMTYREMGQLDKALEEFELVLAQEPDNPSALVNVGEMYVQKGELDNAVQYFEKAIAQAPGDEVLPFNVAEIYFNTGNPQKAIEYYQQASAAKPDWPEPHLKLGYAYLNLGKMDEAAAAFEKVVEIAPDTPQAQMAQAALQSIKQ